MSLQISKTKTRRQVSETAAFHKLFEISQKVARSFSNSCSKVAQKKSKVAFCYESCSEVAPKLKKLLLSPFISSDAKGNKSKISKHFVQFCGVTTNQRC